MGSLERRARRLEEEAELRKRSEQRAAERTLREALSRVSTPELQAMSDYFARTDREEWREEDEPLMRRLVGLIEEVRHEREAGDFPWRAETQEEREHDD